MQPTHVVVDTRDGYTWAFDADAKPFTYHTASKFADVRNSERKPETPPFKLFRLKEDAEYIL